MKKSQLSQANRPLEPNFPPGYAAAPNEPNWQHWLAAQSRETRGQKIREGAGYHAAALVIGAHAVSWATRKNAGEARVKLHNKVGSTAGRLLPRVARQYEKVSTAAETRPTRIRKIGKAVLGAANVTTEFIKNRSTTVAERQRERIDTTYPTYDVNRSRVARKAHNHRESLIQEKLDKHSASLAEFDRQRERARARYASVAPLVEEFKNDELIKGERHKTLRSLDTQAEHLVTALYKEDIGEFSKSVPGRAVDRHTGSIGYPFDGDYLSQATSTLQTATDNFTKPDGSIRLLDRSHWQETIEGAGFQSPAEVQAVERNASDYISGVGTLLWQLGFVEYDNETDIPMAQGKFNPNIEWGRDEDNIIYSLPFDSANPLHQTLAGGSAPGHSVQIVMPIEPHHTDLSLRLR